MAKGQSHRPARTVEEERLRRKQRLAATFRLFAERGFDEGVGGHVTARDPERTDHFWINPLAVHFAHIRVSDLLLVAPDGTVVEGEGRINPAGFAIHSAVHAARRDAVAAAHTHSLHGRAFAALGRPLLPITQDSCAFFEDHAVHGDFSGVVTDREEGERIAESLGSFKAVILRNHGLLTVGGTVEEAAWWFLTMDRSCQVQLLAEAAGEPHLIDPASARHTYGTIGTPEMGRFNFRPLYADIVRRHPDLLD
ncbi:class II aldolase/adducin family protein [Saccharomonospora xinjiangensis]|uniref:class II aldolase/adducin family protein n=1 Tax=Saccharomonospora xinjiangensis TaxID=75294 RepID=UPI00106FDF1B|nr:class II aldolase/adducin family protein [Saccharomonospora xinjiangensis]QBQ60763.1 Decarboxylase NovR [Saccharomonospora xinjiangensis]